jgi:hypothetical protein
MKIVKTYEYTFNENEINVIIQALYFYKENHNLNREEILYKKVCDTLNEITHDKEECKCGKSCD